VGKVGSAGILPANWLAGRMPALRRRARQTEVLGTLLSAP